MIAGILTITATFLVYIVIVLDGFQDLEETGTGIRAFIEMRPSEQLQVKYNITLDKLICWLTWYFSKLIVPYIERQAGKAATGTAGTSA